MVTGDEIDSFLYEISNEDFIYTASMEQIVMRFLSKKIDNVYKMELDQIRNNFLRVFCETDEAVPHTKNEFLNYVSLYYLDLASAPKDHYITFSLGAANDIKEINERINEYKQQISNLRSKPTTDSHYEVKQYSYLIEKLMQAKHEIADYLATDIKKISLKKARSPWMTSLLAYNWTYHYDYKNHKDRYTPYIFSDVANKFLDLPVLERPKIINMYEQYPDEFLKFVQIYIREKDIVQEIFHMLNNNHHLFVRKSIIQQSLEAYEKNNKALFTHVIPVQIEGIIFDYCLEMGISYKQIDKVSWEEKFKIIHEKDEGFPHFEYYAYKFPLIRNKVAHGRQLVQEETEYNILADMLLLDLFSVCSLLYSERLKINKARSILDAFSNSDHYSKSANAMEYVLYYTDTDIPDFYRDSILINEDLSKYLQSDDFWATVDYYLSLNEGIINRGLLSVMKIIKGLGISVDKSTQYIKDISKTNSMLDEIYNHFQYEFENENLFINMIKFRAQKF